MIRYYTIKYTDDMPNANTGGYARAWMVRIRPRYHQDQGIHAHEIQGHVKRWWQFALIGCGLMMVLALVGHIAMGITWFYGLIPLGIIFYNLYYATPRGRLNEEARAYKIQLSYPPATNDPTRSRDEYRRLYAESIAHKYGLSVDTETAYSLLGDT